MDGSGRVFSTYYNIKQLCILPTLCICVFAVGSPQKKKKKRTGHFTTQCSPFRLAHGITACLHSLQICLSYQRQAKQHYPIQYRIPCHQVGFWLQFFFVFLFNNTEDKNPQPFFQSPDLEEVFKRQQVYQTRKDEARPALFQISFYCVVLSLFVLFCCYCVVLLLFVLSCYYLCCSMYFLCVNVYCTTATGCLPNCSWQIYQYKERHEQTNILLCQCSAYMKCVKAVQTGWNVISLCVCFVIVWVCVCVGIVIVWLFW